jgi:hypothetical protein
MTFACTFPVFLSFDLKALNIRWGRQASLFFLGKKIPSRKVSLIVNNSVPPGSPDVHQLQTVTKVTKLSQNHKLGFLFLCYDLLLYLPFTSSQPLLEITVVLENYFFKIFFWGIFFFFLFVQYSALLHLPPLRFHCADGCWDRTQDRCNWCIGSQTL